MLHHLSIQGKPLFVSRIEVGQTLVLPVHAQKQAGAKFLLQYKSEMSANQVNRKI